jgi:hypothetical protein
MKAYLCLIDDPYYKKQSVTSSKEPIPMDSTLLEEEGVDLTGYEEVDLLPREIPENIRVHFTDRVLFHAHRFMEITRVTKGKVLYVVDRELCLLQPGDIILSGTPSGVGPVKPGDVIEAGVNGVGTIKFKMV